ncbi:MAG: hypothetical protein N2315_08805, partial [Thermanaerothrix sp.]|nr:hypothetical protein [Thermanaerothrix sp.]
MAVAAERYVRISDTIGVLRDLLDRGFAFLVPSGPDEEALLEILLDASPVLDERPHILRWKDLYRLILREAYPRSLDRASRMMDPADRYLVLRWLTGTLPKDRCPSWVFDPLFPELAAPQMMEFMREEVTRRHLFAANGCESCESCPLDSPGRVLCHLFCAYQDYLRENRMADEAEMPTLTRQALEGAVPSVKLAVVGFMSFTHGQLNLLRKMIELGMGLHFLFPWIDLEGFPHGARQLNLPISRTLGEPRPPRVLRIMGIDPSHQYEELARRISLLGDEKGGIPFQGPLDQVALSVPMEDIRTLTHQLHLSLIHI